MILSGSVSAKPLYDWFAKDKNNRATLKKFYSDARITNWKTRGIPRAEVGNVAQFMGLTYEQYIAEASVGKEWRQVAVIAFLSLSLAFNATSHNANPQSLFSLSNCNVYTFLAYLIAKLADKMFRIGQNFEKAVRRRLYAARGGDCAAYCFHP